MTRKYMGKGALCFYCGGVTTFKASVGDHMPIPARHGGTNAVPCCTSCHDMKDRISLYHWSTEWFNTVLADWPKLSRETRIFLAKTAAAYCDAVGPQLGVDMGVSMEGIAEYVKAMEATPNAQAQ
jgi:hypothetical protein